MVDPAQVGLDVEELVVGEQRVLRGGRGAAGRGQRLHRGQVRGPLRVEEGCAGRPDISASTTLVNSTDWSCGCGSSGSPSQASRSVTPSGVIEYRLRSGPAPASTPDDLDQPVPDELGQRAVDLTEPDRLGAAEPPVVRLLQVVAVPGGPLEQPEQRVGDSHARHYTHRVYPREILVS